MSAANVAKNMFRSERLIYRPFDPKDEKLHQFIHEHVNNDPVVMALSDSELLKPHDKKSTTNYIESLSRYLIAVAICLPPSEVADANPNGEGEAQQTNREDQNKAKQPTTIGLVALSPMPGGREHHRNSSVAICLAEEYQGKGYGGEAINWVVDWGFQHAGLHRIAISTVSYNERAVKLYERLGFVLDGRKREKILFNRGWHDMVDMSMLEHEWEALRTRGKQEATT